MPHKSVKQVALLASAAVFAGACSLLPNFGGENMSSAEKAKLNMQMGVRYLELGILDVAQEKLELGSARTPAIPKPITHWQYFTNASKTTMKP